MNQNIFIEINLPTSKFISFVYEINNIIKQEEHRDISADDHYFSSCFNSVNEPLFSNRIF